MKRIYENPKTININFQGKEENNNDSDKFGKIGKIIETVKNLIKDLANAPWQKVAKILVIIAVVFIFIILGFFAYGFVANKEVANKVVDYVVTKPDVEENYRMNARTGITDNVNYELSKLLYTVGASRCFILEVHNGKENATNLPFVYLDMSYEIINDNYKEVDYISDYYQNVPISHYNFPNVVVKKYICISSVENVREFDARFVHVMESRGAEYFGCILLKSRKHKIGFLCAVYEKGNKTKINSTKLDYNLRETAKVLSPLLDLSSRRKNKPKYETNTFFNNEEKEIH